MIQAHLRKHDAQTQRQLQQFQISAEKTLQVQQESEMRSSYQERLAQQIAKEHSLSQSEEGQQLESLIQRLKEEKEARIQAETTAAKLEVKIQALQEGIAQTLINQKALNHTEDPTEAHIQKKMRSIVDQLNDNQRELEVLQEQQKSLEEAKQTTLKRQLSLEEAIRLQQKRNP